MNKVKTLLAIGLTVMTFALAGPLSAADVETRKDFSVAGKILEVDNLAGSVKLLEAKGDKFEIQATVKADKSAGLTATEIADLIGFYSVKEGSKHKFRVLYPVDDYRKYTYRDGSNRGNNSTRVRYQKKRVSVSSKARSDALNVHVDLVIRVPNGSSLRVKNRVGPIKGNGLQAKLNLDTGSGEISIEKSQGSLRADTGSGRVTVVAYTGDILANTGSGSVTGTDVEGNVSADPGSGSVTVTDVDGDVNADTGSGSVELNNVHAEEIFVDTGSGRVILNNVSGSLRVDTGSGSVTAKKFLAGEIVDVDTGSGNIAIAGDLGAVRKLRLDTGSGGVRVKTNQALNMVLRIETGSGGIDVDLPDLSNVTSKDNQFEAQIGRGDGQGIIDTGSGSVTVSMK
ncbi:MAG: DUF4097 family beta strand repeat-containing protein [Gammaproteobacteria bacterium]|nr:DUF4097 family beta strand repeat-containing protein [Gammaproteobacteria bacterium]